VANHNAPGDLGSAAVMPNAVYWVGRAVVRPSTKARKRSATPAHSAGLAAQCGLAHQSTSPATSTGWLGAKVARRSPARRWRFAIYGAGVCNMPHCGAQF